MKYTAWLLAAAVAAACGGDAPRPAPSPLPSSFPSGDARLAFTLDLPPGTGPFPAVVLAHGSGQVTRDQLTWLSARFTQLGFAVLRFDKRGVGGSTGTYSNVGVGNSPTMIPLLAEDVAAGVRFLRTRTEIDARKIGLAGNSQAGWILPHAARALGDGAFVVILAGPVCSVGLEIYYSSLGEFNERPLDEVYALLPAFAGAPGYDPVPVLSEVNTPTLWLLGEDDRSIPVRNSVVNLAALKAAGRPFDWRIYPGLGHSLGPQIWNDIGPWIARFR
jgi:pimeloyl-ACP methyl ester carboxylesterase